MSPRSGPRPSSWGGGRDRLLAAARAVFAEKGYERGGIREIAARAEVTDVMIYKHFGSKSALFEAATIEPFSSYVTGYIEEWTTRGPARRTPLEEAYDFLRGLYDVLHGEREILTAMISVRQFDPGFAAGSGRVEEAFDDALARYEQLIATETAKQGYPEFDAHMWARLIFGSVLSMAVHGDMLNNGEFPSPERAITELAELTVRAVTSGGRTATR
jgi:AcrR family transcriptional regulator